MGLAAVHWRRLGAIAAISTASVLLGPRLINRPAIACVLPAPGEPWPNCVELVPLTEPVLPTLVKNELRSRIVQNADVPRDAIRVVSATREVWTDSCLGLEGYCPIYSAIRPPEHS